MSDIKSDAELVVEVRSGNNDSFEELTKRYAAKVYGLAKRLVRTQEDAEEVLQDVFVAIYKKIATFEGKSSFSSWVYRITVNASLMKNRAVNRDIPVGDDLNKEHYPLSVDEEVSRRELLSVLDEAIKLLPEEYKPVYVMRDVNGFSSREVSKLLNVSIPAVKSRLHRSRFILREKLANL